MNLSTPNYWAVVPAAGEGKRLSDYLPKQFQILNGLPVAEHTFHRLLGISCINKIISPCDLSSPHWQNIKACRDHRIELISGGQTRAESVMSGLSALKGIARPEDWILVHDIARPCVTKSDINKLIMALDGNAVGGILATPVNETLKVVHKKNHIKKTVDRGNYRLAQTPQMFRYQVLYDALTSASDNNMFPTDEASAIEAMDKDILIIEGRQDNIKITRHEDLMIAESILTRQEKNACV